MTKKTNLENEVCSCDKPHLSVIEEVRKKMPSEDALYDMSELFKVFGDSTRTGILAALACGELCVCDVCTLLSMTKSAISHQLRVLKQAKLIKSRRSGKNIIYELADEHVVTIIKQGVDHILE